MTRAAGRPARSAGPGLAVVSRVRWPRHRARPRAAASSN